MLKVHTIVFHESVEELEITVKGPKKDLPDLDGIAFESKRGSHTCRIHQQANQLYALGLVVEVPEKVNAPDGPSETYAGWFKNFVPQGQGGIMSAEDEAEVRKQFGGTESDSDEAPVTSDEEVDLLDPKEDVVAEVLAEPTTTSEEVEEPFEESETEEEDEEEEDDRPERLKVLLGTKRKNLIALAKKNGLKAVGKNVDLAEAIYAAETAPPPEDDEELPEEPGEESEEEEESEAPKPAPKKKTRRVGGAKKGRKKAEPKKSLLDPVRTDFDPILAQVKVLIAKHGGKRCRDVFNEIVKLETGAATGEGKATVGHVPGMVVSITRHHKTRPDGTEWGTCEYTVRCEEGGAYTLLAFRGKRPELVEAASEKRHYKDANALFRAFTLRDYPRVTFEKFFNLGKAKAEGRMTLP